MSLHVLEEHLPSATTASHPACSALTANLLLPTTCTWNRNHQTDGPSSGNNSLLCLHTQQWGQISHMVLDRLTTTTPWSFNSLVKVLGFPAEVKTIGARSRRTTCRDRHTRCEPEPDGVRSYL